MEGYDKAEIYDMIREAVESNDKLRDLLCADNDKVAELSAELERVNEKAKKLRKIIQELENECVELRDKLGIKRKACPSISPVKRVRTDFVFMDGDASCYELKAKERLGDFSHVRPASKQQGYLLQLCKDGEPLESKGIIQKLIPKTDDQNAIRKHTATLYKYFSPKWAHDHVIQFETGRKVYPYYAAKEGKKIQPSYAWLYHKCCDSNEM